MSRKIENVIVRILNGSEDINDLQLFSEWYNSSEENRKYFLKIKNIYDRRIGGLYPDENEINFVWHRINKSINEKTNKKRRIFVISYISGIAAVAFALIIFGVTIKKNSATEQNWVEIITPPGSEPRTIILPDGSELILNASSYMKYPENFTSDKREVYLDGEAFFKVVKNDDSEFVVHTVQQTIEVLGTEFNVLAYSSDSGTITTLIEGKIKLNTYGNDNLIANEIILQPEQQTYFDKNLSEITVSEIDINDVLTWINGVYSFRESSLQEITNRLGRVIGVTFIISDEELGKEEYTGKFFYYQTPEDILEVLNFKNEFQHKINNDTILLFKE